MQFIKVNELDKSLIKELDLSSYIMLSNYYREYYQEKFSEESFVILDQGMALVVVFCSVLDKEFTLPDGACQINFVRHLPEKVEKKVIKSMLSYISEIADKSNCGNIIIKDVFNESSLLSVLGQELFNQKFHANLTFEMQVDSEGFTPKSFKSALISTLDSGLSCLSIQ